MSTCSSVKLSLKRSHVKNEYHEDRCTNSSGGSVKDSPQKRRKHAHKGEEKEADVFVERSNGMNNVEVLLSKKKKKEKHGQTSSPEQLNFGDDNHLKKRAEMEPKDAAKEHKKRHGHVKHLRAESVGSDAQDSVLKDGKKKKKAKKDLKTVQRNEKSLAHSESSEDETYVKHREVHTVEDNFDATLTSKIKREKEGKKKKKSNNHRKHTRDLSPAKNIETSTLTKVIEACDSDQSSDSEDNIIEHCNGPVASRGAEKMNTSKGNKHLKHTRKLSLKQTPEKSKATKVVELCGGGDSDSEEDVNKHTIVVSRREKIGRNAASKHRKDIREPTEYGKQTTTTTKVIDISDSESSDSEESINEFVSGGDKTVCSPQPAKISRGSHKKQSRGQHTKVVEEVGELLHATWNLNADQIQQLQKRGISLRKGAWSHKEVEVLKSNMESYLKKNNMTEEEAGYLIFRNDVDGKYFKELSTESDFYRHLGRGISRPLFAIYRRVLRMYDKGNYLGRYTEEEEKELKRLVALHGHKWSLIGRMMGRSSLSVNHKFVAQKAVKGVWTKKEVEQLKTAVRTLSKTHKGSPVHGDVEGDEDWRSCTEDIEWAAVAQLVETRNAEQCRRKWLDSICWQGSQRGTRWNAKDNLKLIKKVYESGAADEADLDWSELIDTTWKNVHSPQWLHMKWTHLKRNVPKNHVTSFEGAVEYLYHVYSPAVRAKSRTICEIQSDEAEAVQIN